MTINYIEGWMNATQPHHMMQAKRASGWLRDHAPELDRLYGVPQRPEHHPEIDVGIHVELTLEMASLLTRDPRVRYAALVHDLGKALTPAADWPRHHDHELLGVKPGLVLGRRLGVPKEWRLLGALVSRFHLRVHKTSEASPRSLVRLFRDAKFFHHPQLLEPFTLACEADARGRAGLQDRAYPQGILLRRAFSAARGAVQNGSELQLHESRIHAVAAALNDSAPV